MADGGNFDRASDSALDEAQDIVEVKCGDLQANLITKNLSCGKSPCIDFEGSIITPCEFQRKAGKESNKNWKVSIRHQDQPLSKFLFKDGTSERKGRYRFNSGGTDLNSCSTVQTEGTSTMSSLRDHEPHNEVELLSPRPPDCISQLSDFQPDATQQRDPVKRSSVSVPSGSLGK